jgi:hypothetical protein
MEHKQLSESKITYCIDARNANESWWENIEGFVSKTKQDLELICLTTKERISNNPKIIIQNWDQTKTSSGNFLAALHLASGSLSVCLWSTIDSLGNITYTSPGNSSILHLFNNRFILYLNEKNYKRKEGIIDEKGIAIVHPEYQSFGNWWNNKKRIVITKDKRDTLLDYNGKVIIPLSDKIESADEDLFFVKNDLS